MVDLTGIEPAVFAVQGQRFPIKSSGPKGRERIVLPKGWTIAHAA